MRKCPYGFPRGGISNIKLKKKTKPKLKKKTSPNQTKPKPKYNLKINLKITAVTAPALPMQHYGMSYFYCS